MLKIAYSEHYPHPLPEGHRFPMSKYELIPKQLMYEGVIQAENLFIPEPANRSNLELTHTPSYLDALQSLTLDEKHIRRIGFPLSKRLIEREWTIVQGTIDCTQYALKFGVSMNVAGGTHHAFANRGEGFCMLNDIAVAANVLLNQRQASRILVTDLDVHQGNGTARLFENNKNVFTFSMHGKNNYPFHKEKSSLDIELEDGITDLNYLNLLENNLENIINNFKPDFMFYQSGVDILESDKLGKLRITKEGCKKRDEIVFRACRENNIPVVAAMGGGYSPQLKDIVNAHCETFKTASSIFFDEI